MNDTFCPWMQFNNTMNVLCIAWHPGDDQTIVKYLSWASSAIFVILMVAQIPFFLKSLRIWKHMTTPSEYVFDHDETYCVLSLYIIYAVQVLVVTMAV